MLKGVRVWITGASSGIGRALALAVLAGGGRVVASGRRAEALETLRPAGAPERLLVVPFDVKDGEAAVAAAKRIEDEWGGVDWVVLNAGDCQYLDPRRWDDEVVREMMAINFFAALHVARAALPLLEAGPGRGLLAYVSSAAVLAPLPRGGAYGASKAAAGYFLESLGGHYPNLDVSLVVPGFVKTPLTDKNDFAMPTLMSAEAAAAVILAGLRRRRAVIRFPRRLVFALFLINRLPARWRQAVLARMARNE